jgi:hypothetical protein
MIALPREYEMPARSANLSREFNPFALARIETRQSENPDKAKCARLRLVKRVARLYSERLKNLHPKPDNLSHRRSVSIEGSFHSSPDPTAVLDYPIPQRA